MILVAVYVLPVGFVYEKCHYPNHCCFYMGGFRNYGPFLDPYYNAAPNTSV